MIIDARKLASHFPCKSCLRTLHSHAALACYKMLSAKNPAVCIFIKGLISGLMPLLLAAASMGANWVGSLTSIHFLLHPDIGKRQTKVTLQCGSEDDLLLLQAQAQSLKLCARSIQDAYDIYRLRKLMFLLVPFYSGRTQIAAGSRTVLGIAGALQLLGV